MSVTDLSMHTIAAGKLLNPLCTGDFSMRSLGNSEDSDEMQHNAAFHQGLHCLPLRQKRSSEKEMQYYKEIKTCDPSIY